MPMRNVVLTERTERQEALIDALVQSGHYENASEVMREGLRLVENREAKDAAKLFALCAAAQAGAAALEKGEFKEFPDAASLTAYLKRLGKAAISSPEARRAINTGVSALAPKQKGISHTS